MSSLVKKYVMAVTGFALAAFLLMHMLGNLQALEGGPHAINAYAHFLQTLPWEFLWGFRLGLAACIVVHFLVAVLLVIENKKARPQTYSIKKFIASTPSARYMIYTGVLILLFAALHILHFTMLKLDPVFARLDWVATSGMYEGKTIHDVYAMLIVGFSSNLYSIGYIVIMAAIGLHLVHAVSSMFQSVGLRNEQTRYKLNKIAIVYAVVIFGGFSLNPLAVLLGKYTNIQLMPKEVVKQVESKKAGDAPIFVDYNFLNKCDKPAAHK